MLTLGNDMIALTLDPDNGARVTSLKDRRSGREWLVQGDRPVPVAEQAVFNAEVAWGWDECFPTVTVADGSAFGWDGMLRDHGALWGRPWSCSDDAGVISAVFDTPDFRFERKLTLEGAGILAAYRIANTGEARFGFVYSQHMLIAARPGERLIGRGLGPLQTDAGDDAGRLAARTDLTPVRDISAGTAVKLYAPLQGPCEIRCTGLNGTLAIAYDSPFLPVLGLWGCYGGWPKDRPVHQLALEPTTAPAGALSPRSVSWLHPGQKVEWSIRIALSPPNVMDGMN